MKRSLLLCLVLSSLFLAGCWHRSKQPKESTAVATEVEEAFKQRWIEKRAGELTARGLAADAARRQANDEFRARYSYTRAADK